MYTLLFLCVYMINSTVVIMFCIFYFNKVPSLAFGMRQMLVYLVLCRNRNFFCSF